MFRLKPMLPSKMWEILVPTEMLGDKGVRPIRTRYHRVWDEKVRAISGGMSIMKPIKGHYVSQEVGLIVERMIPVRIIASQDQIKKIMELSLKYYNQEAILAYEISSNVLMLKRPTKEKKCQTEIS